MIYSIAEWKLKGKLKEENESVPNQKGKPTKIPTMRWIFFIFQGITELFTQEDGEIDSEVLRAYPKSVVTYCNFYNCQYAKPERILGYYRPIVTL